MLNFVFDEVIEYFRDVEDVLKILDEIRVFGLLVCRGMSVMVVLVLDLMEEIVNLFLVEDGGVI